MIDARDVEAHLHYGGPTQVLEIRGIRCRCWGLTIGPRINMNRSTKIAFMRA